MLRNTKLNEKKHSRKRKKYDSVSYLTGDVGLNIDFFNNRMGTADTLTDIATPDSTNSSDTAANTGEALCETKRYVRRYLLKPMNKFASNKAEVLKALVDIGDQNCTIYTLNNLEDNSDIGKLTNNDIIYTYDDGILKDKNGVRVLDYDLSIKKEENRKKFAKPDPSSKEFKAEYEDRMTSATELEEDYFNLDFDSVNVFGEKLTEAKRQQCCCICGEDLDGYGNNPEPYMSSDSGSCCDACNVKFVIPMRYDSMRRN